MQREDPSLGPEAGFTPRSSGDDCGMMDRRVSSPVEAAALIAMAASDHVFVTAAGLHVDQREIRPLAFVLRRNGYQVLVILGANF